MFRIKKKKTKMEHKVLSERVLGCHDVVLLRFMHFFFFDNQPYNPTLPTPTSLTWVHEPLKPLRLGEVPTHLTWAVVLYACFSIQMDGGFTTSHNNVTC